VIDDLCSGTGREGPNSPEVSSGYLIQKASNEEVLTVSGGVSLDISSPKKSVKKAEDTGRGVPGKVKGKPGRPSLTDEEKAVKKAERKALKKKLLEEAALKGSEGGAECSGDVGKLDISGSGDVIAGSQLQSVVTDPSLGPPKKKRGRPAGKTNSDSSKVSRQPNGSTNTGEGNVDDENRTVMSPVDKDKNVEKNKAKKDFDKGRDSLATTSPRQQIKATAGGEGGDHLTSTKAVKTKEEKEPKRGVKSNRNARKRGSGDISAAGMGESAVAPHQKRGKSKNQSGARDDPLCGGIPRMRRSRSELRQSASIGEIFTALTDIRKSYFAVQNVLRLQVGISGLNQEGLDNLNKKISNPLSVVTLPIPPSSEIATCLDIIELHSNRLNDTLLGLYEYQVELQQRSLLNNRKEEELASSKESIEPVPALHVGAPVGDSECDHGSKPIPIAGMTPDISGGSAPPPPPARPSRSGLGGGLSISIPLATTGGNGADVARQLSTVHVSSPITILKKIRNNSSPRGVVSKVSHINTATRSIAGIGSESERHKSPLELYNASLFLSNEQYAPFLQSNIGKASRARMVHVTAPVSAAVQDPRFTDHQLAFQRKDLESKRASVTAEIRRRKIRTLHAWESLGDKYLEVNHHWKHYVDHCGPKAVEEQYVEKLGPRLRAISAISSTSANMSASSSAGRTASGTDRDLGRSTPARFSSLRATSDMVRNDFDEEKRLQHQAMVELMKRRLEFGTADIPPMCSPWVQADNAQLPLAPVWPPAGMHVPDYFIPKSTKADVPDAVASKSSLKSVVSTATSSSAFTVDVGEVSQEKEKGATDVSSLLLPTVPYPKKIIDTTAVVSSNGDSSTEDATVLSNDSCGKEMKAVALGTAPVEEQAPNNSESVYVPSKTDLAREDVCQTEASITETQKQDRVSTPPVPDEIEQAQTLKQELEFPKYVGNIPDIVDFNGCRLTLNGRRQFCAQVAIGTPCPPGCNCAKQVDKLERMSRVWSDMEKCIFVDKFMQFPKNFHKISSFLVNRSTRDCIKFYYDSKAIIPYKSLLREFDNRKRSVKNNWSHTCQAALSVGGVIYSPQQQLDDKEPHCELPAGETAFTAHANHPPYMAIAKGLETPDEYGQYREAREDALVHRPPRALTDFLVARRHWKKVYDTQSTTEAEKLCKTKKNTLIVGDSLFQSKVPPKWVYLQDDEYIVYNDNNSSSSQKWSSSDEATQQLYHCRMGNNQTLVYQHPPSSSPNSASNESSNYLSSVNAARKKKSKKEAGAETASVYGGYGMGSEYLAYAPLPTATTVHAAKQRNTGSKSSTNSTGISWDGIYPLEFTGDHTIIQRDFPERCRFPIRQVISKRMSSTRSRSTDVRRARSRNKIKEGVVAAKEKNVEDSCSSSRRSQSTTRSTTLDRKGDAAVGSGVEVPIKVEVKLEQGIENNVESSQHSDPERNGFRTSDANTAPSSRETVAAVLESLAEATESAAVSGPLHENAEDVASGTGCCKLSDVSPDSEVCNEMHKELSVEESDRQGQVSPEAELVKEEQFDVTSAHNEVNTDDDGDETKRNEVDIMAASDVLGSSGSAGASTVLVPPEHDGEESVSEATLVGKKKGLEGDSCSEEPPAKRPALSDGA